MRRMSVVLLAGTIFAALAAVYWQDELGTRAEPDTRQIANHAKPDGPVPGDPAMPSGSKGKGKRDGAVESSTAAPGTASEAAGKNGPGRDGKGKGRGPSAAPV